MTDYYDQSYPPSLWAPPPEPEPDPLAFAGSGMGATDPTAAGAELELEGDPELEPAAAGSVADALAVGDADQVLDDDQVADALAVGDVYDPAAHTVAEVQAYVDGHPDEAGAVLDAERARGDQARTTLVTWLEGRPSP